MKTRILFILILAVAAIQKINAQNTFPSTGNVGIGTTDTSTNLTIKQQKLNNDTKSMGIRLTGPGVSGGNASGLLFSIGYNGTRNKQLWVGDYDYMGDATKYFFRMGVYSGTAALDAVSGDGMKRGRVQIGVFGDVNSGVMLANTQVRGGMGIGTNAGAAALDGSLGTNNFSVDGNVGIGTTSPTAKLEVKGNAIANEPTENNHLTTKGYVDNAIANIDNSSTGDNLGNHTATQNLNLSGKEIDNIGFADVKSGNGNGVRFWSSNSYKISMGNTSEYRFGPVTDYSIKTSMSNTSGRGWTWGIAGATPVVAFSNIGDAKFAKNVSAAAPTEDNHLTTKSYVDNLTNSNTGGVWEENGTNTYYNEGNVGIGTTSPTAKLHVSSGTSGDAILSIEADTDNNNEGDNARINLLQDGNSLGAIIGFNKDWVGADNVFRIATKYSNVIDEDAFVIDGKGNDSKVGIGTATPKEKLHINGSIRGNQSGAVRISTGNGYVDIGPKSGSHMHFYTDKSNYFFNKELRVDTGIIGSYNEDLQLRTQGSTDLTILNSNGNVGIGTTSPSQKLSVNGNIRSKEVIVEATPWPDYVFTPEYTLSPLKEVEQFIAQKGHLPNIPSAKEVEQNGIQLGNMNAKLLEKIEELTLYTIEQENRIEELEKQNEKIKELEKLVNQLIEKNEK